MKTALTIAGSDSCGGAGIQADLKTFSVLGVYGMSALTAVTAQNTLGVQDSLSLDPRLIQAQVKSVADDIMVDATKTGMLATTAVVEAVADAIAKHHLQPYVCDPVVFAKSGYQLVKDDAIESICRRLFPLATVVTPNRREAAMLAGLDADQVITVFAAREAARRIVGRGALAVVVKGIDEGGQSVDVFYDGAELAEFRAARQLGRQAHGSGCTFSAAITAGLASGMSLAEAIEQAKQLVTAAIQHSSGLGHGTAPVNVLAFKPHRK